MFSVTPVIAVPTTCNGWNHHLQTAILLDCTRELIHMESNLIGASGFMEEEKRFQKTTLECSPVFELVEMVLRPSKGGPPDLPEQSDAVCA